MDIMKGDAVQVHLCGGILDAVVRNISHDDKGERIELCEPKGTRSAIDTVARRASLVTIKGRRNAYFQHHPEGCEGCAFRNSQCDKNELLALDISRSANSDIL
jgi:hypothetical protein